MSDDTLEMLAPVPNGTLRRWFYWLSLLVLISIAVQTALEVLDVHVFPRQSWSEGISPRVVQSRNSKLYFEYIGVGPSDLQLKLPPGVQPSFLGVAAVVHPRNTAAKLLIRAMTIPDDLFFLALVWMMRSMVLAAWKSPVEPVTPFIRGNVWRLRWIAALFGAMWVYHGFLPLLTDEVSLYSALDDIGRNVIGEVPPWYLTNGYLAVALLLLVLAQVFSHGVRLQKDVEGLV
jgi:hypothetical protein